MKIKILLVPALAATLLMQASASYAKDVKFTPMYLGDNLAVDFCKPAEVVGVRTVYEYRRKSDEHSLGECQQELFVSCSDGRVTTNITPVSSELCGKFNSHPSAHFDEEWFR